jgi:hypothetical protein
VCLMHFSICHSCNVYYQLLSSNVLRSKRAALLSTLCLYGLIVCPSVSNLLQCWRLVHSTMKAAILISLGVEFCEYNQSVGAFLLVRLVESSGCQGVEGSLIELLCPYLYGHGDMKLTSLIFHQICFLGDQNVFPLLSTASDIKFEYSWICSVLQKRQPQPCC